jgi:Protein of unknown function (DUF1552)
MGKLRRPLDRRTFLRGAGAALALPWLEAMAPRAARAAASGKPPVRLACIYFPNGVWQPAWIPKQEGADYELPFSLTPLAALKKHMLVLSGLDKAHSRGGDGHYAKTANFLTGLVVMKTTGKDVSVGGVSIDQLVAAKVGHLTPLPSLELGTEPVISGIDSNVGYTRLYGSYISWRSPTQPVAKEINPKLVYERLFGPKDAKGEPLPGGRRDGDRGLLDLALEDARSLRARLGRDDQLKIDEYLDAVRAVERRLEYASQPDPRDWKPDTAPAEATPPGVPKDFREHIRVMLDLMTLAFWTDSTRVCSFMFANDVSGRNFSFLDAVKGGHHDTSHHENRPEKTEQYQRINRWHAEQFAGFLDRLKAIKEGEGTLLDNSMVLFGCGMSDGNRHDPNNLPILLGGHGGGALNPGRHIASPKNTPLCNLYVSILRAAGVRVESFGDSTGPLPGVLA